MRPVGGEFSSRPYPQPTANFVAPPEPNFIFLRARSSFVISLSLDALVPTRRKVQLFFFDDTCE
jgi:hypothetical protein